jgi:hypothetical protein
MTRRPRRKTHRERRSVNDLLAYVAAFAALIAVVQVRGVASALTHKKEIAHQCLLGHRNRSRNLQSRCRAARAAARSLSGRYLAKTWGRARKGSATSASSKRLAQRKKSGPGRK